MPSATSRQLLRVLALAIYNLYVNGQTISPQNDISAVAGGVQYTMDTVIKNMPIHPALAPLTDEAGRGGSFNQRQVSTFMRVEIG